METMTKAEAICKLVTEHNFSVFPCNANKRPWDILNDCLLNDWQNGNGNITADDLTDRDVALDTIQAVLDSGYVFGTVPGNSGHVVVDIDTPQPFNDKAEWKASPKDQAQSVINSYIRDLVDQFPDFSQAFASCPSMSGYGAHCWFRSYRPLTKYGCGMRGDIIGTNGYVIMADPVAIVKGLETDTDDNTLELFTQIRDYWHKDRGTKRQVKQSSQPSSAPAASKSKSRKKTVTVKKHDYVTPIVFKGSKQPLLSEEWPEGCRHDAITAHYVYAWNSNDLELEQRTMEKDLSFGSTEEQVSHRYRNARSWWEDNQFEHPVSMSHVEKYKFISSELLAENPLMERVYATAESATPKYYMNYSENTGWTTMRVSDLQDAMTRVIDPYLNKDDSISKILRDAVTYHNAQMRHGGTETEWNHSVKSIPFSCGTGKSLGLTRETAGDVMTSPSEDRMSDTLNVTADEYKAVRNADGETEWEQQLALWQPDPTVRRRMRALFGQALIGNDEAAIPIIYGQGGEGKSVFMKAISNALGRNYTTTIKTSYFLQNGINNFEDHSDGLMNLYRARIAWCGEVLNGRTTFKLDRLKAISGGDEIQANRMRQNNVNFTARAMPVVFGNHLPKLADIGKSTRRRFHIISFNVNMEEKLGAANMVKGADMDDMLDRMRPEIIAWLVDGLMDYYSLGKVLPECKSIDDETNSWFGSNDLLTDQLKFCLEESPHDRCHLNTLAELLMDHYKADYKHGIDNRWLATELRNRKFSLVKTNKGLAIEGYYVRQMPKRY